MTLKELEAIIRPNFVWETASNKKWLLEDTDRRGHITAGIIVFVGAAWICGFKDSLVYDYLDINRAKHFAYLSRFKNAIRLFNASTLNELYTMEDTSLEGKVMKKYRIVENALKIKNDIQFLSVADISF